MASSVTSSSSKRSGRDDENTSTTITTSSATNSKNTNNDNHDPDEDHQHEESDHLLLENNDNENNDEENGNDNNRTEEFLDEQDHEEDAQNNSYCRNGEQDNSSHVTSNNNQDHNSNNNSSSSSQQQHRWHTLLLTTATPDRPPRAWGFDLLEHPAAVKWLKFVTVTMAGICVVHWFIRKMNWEYRKHFSLEQFYTYESTMVVVDATMFFVVARLYQQRGVDHLAFLGVAFAATIYASYINNFSFLQHSVTLYEMHCRWPLALWIFVIVLVPLIVTIILLHVHYAVRSGVFVSKFMELVLAVVFLVVPYATSPYLHLHHWYVGWLVGMHCNFDIWWSRATLAWCWGLYMNGIAVYGRDPVLTCGYTLFLSKAQRCPYLDCYLDGLANPQEHNETNIVHEMKRPDWRNCSADAYHP